MPKERISKAKLDALKPRSERYIVWDAALPGFGVKVHPTGRKSFFVYFRTKSGEQRRPGLGDYDPEHSDLNEIRRRAGDLMQEARKVQTVASRREMPTLASYIKTYYKAVVAKGIKRASTVAEERRKLDKYVLPRLGNMKLDAIEKRDVADLHLSMAEYPVQANRTYSVLRAIFNAAIDDEVLTTPNPCRRIKMFDEKSRDVRLDAADLARLGATLRKAAIRHDGAIRKPRPGSKHAKRVQAGEPFVYKPSPYVIGAIELLAYTGCRRGEVLGLAWDDVDLDGRRLHLRQTKTVPRDVILSDQAVAVLERLKKWRDGRWVFPGREGEKDQPMQGFQKAWQIIRADAGLGSFPLHGFRHLFASVGADLGIPDTVRAELLGHKLGGLTTVMYTHASQEALREAADRVGAWIEAAMTRKPDAEGARVLDATAGAEVAEGVVADAAR